MEYIGITLREYLIEHSKVDQRFIDEFIAIQQNYINNKYGEFAIKMDIVSEWLKIKKGNLKQTLVDSYVENVDYIIIEVPSNSIRGGHNKEDIFLTIKCFKKLCLKTKSHLSDQIVDYYIALETLVVKYQNYIISIITKENQSLKKDMNKKRYPKGGLVYILDFGNGYFKFGSTEDLNERAAVYNTGRIHDVNVVFWLETTNKDSLEACVKSILKPYAVNDKGKEVYFIEVEQIINNIYGCDELIAKTGCSICNKEIEKKDFENHMSFLHEDIMMKRIEIS